MTDLIDIEELGENVVRKMDHDHDPAPRIGEGESDVVAFERIGAGTMVEAYRRELSFRARWSDAFLENAAKNVDDRTMRATLRLATGLEDPPPTVNARQPDA